MRPSTPGPLRHSGQRQAAPVRVPVPRPSGLGYRRSLPLVDGFMGLRLPALCPADGGPAEAAVGTLRDDSGSPGLAHTGVVPSPATAVFRTAPTGPAVCQTSPPTRQRRFPLGPCHVAPPRVAPVRPTGWYPSSLSSPLAADAGLFHRRGKEPGGRDPAGPSASIELFNFFPVSGSTYLYPDDPGLTPDFLRTTPGTSILTTLA